MGIKDIHKEGIKGKGIQQELLRTSFKGVVRGLQSYLSFKAKDTCFRATTTDNRGTIKIAIKVESQGIAAVRVGCL